MKVGDVVQLKCGSFSMVVSDITSAGYVECVWHDQNGIGNLAQYRREVLKLVEDKSIGFYSDRKALASCDTPF